MAQPLPVTVHWADCGLWFPNSKGYLNCFSALQKWLDVAQIIFFETPDEIKTEPRQIASINVEHAPNIPKKGMFKERSPKQEEIHWFNKSPAKQKSISLLDIPDLVIAIFTVSFIILLSAFSQVFSPQNSSSRHRSKYSARGPSLSFGPTIAAVSNR